jgi:hypothetical protein
MGKIGDSQENRGIMGKIGESEAQMRQEERIRKDEHGEIV